MRRAVLLLLTVAIAVACRQREPSGDPKTPPNSPLPKIERPDDEEDTSSPPAPTLAPDAG